MPWTAKDAYSHNKKANTPSMQAQWATVANNILKQTGDEARAIKEANAAIAKRAAPPMKTPLTTPPKKGPPSDGEVNPLTEQSGMAGPQPLPGNQTMGGKTKAPKL